MFKEPDISSSYKKVPVFGEFFYNYVMKHRPKVIIEFGVRQGYSAICMAQALRDLGEGHIYSYDNLAEGGGIQLVRIKHYIETYDVGKWLTFEVKDFYDWMKNPTPFDLLHVDVDNTGDTIKLLKKTFPKKHIIFEGGIPSRDREGQEPMTPLKHKVLVWDFPGLSKL